MPPRGAPRGSEGEAARMDIGSGGTRSRGERARPQGSSAPARQKPLAGLAAFHQFFATTSVPCPYVPGRAERKLIVELAGRVAPGFYDELSRAGFRRSHRFAYRPACRACAACVPVRIAVGEFAHTRSTRRVRNAHARLSQTLERSKSAPRLHPRLFSAERSVRRRPPLIP